jgi:hydroxymethylpyrimidine pyrophosphatase-like HAD family hydrolase/hypoxanthine phosphoribosyltransferase
MDPRLDAPAERPWSPARDSLSPCTIESEREFYREYPWSLNAFPKVREIVAYLQEELRRIEEVQEEWQPQEVATNIFLFSCAIVDSLDDYLLGEAYDFSKVESALHPIAPVIRIANKVLSAAGRLRRTRLNGLRHWEEHWRSALHEFLMCSIAAEPNRKSLLEARAGLVSLLSFVMPAQLYATRPKLPAFFRSRDFSHFDCLQLGEKFVTACPQRDRPVLVVGLRTAGSYLGAMLRAYLGREGYRQIEMVTVRPGKGVAPWENAQLKQSAKRSARALIVDEPVHSGGTLVKAVSLLRQAGFAEGDITALVPADPAVPNWRNSYELQSLKISVISLEPDERYKVRLLESNAVEVLLHEYFARRGYQFIGITSSPIADQLNLQWRTTPPDKVDTRLKRLYAVRLESPSGSLEVRHVLAKSVGWGWLAYHAFIAGDSLGQFTPPVLGLRDGILYTEWISQGDAANSLAENREALVNSLSAYVVARTRTLRIARDPSPDLSARNRHHGFALLASLLSQAYGSQIAAALKVPRIQQELPQQHCPCPIMTDSKMSPVEWVQHSGRLLKTDFEHHCQGKTELGMTDPSYDLAEAILHFRLSQNESSRLVQNYEEQSGDFNVKERLFYSKLLAGTWSQMRALSGLNNPRSLDRCIEWHRQFVEAWNFLVIETMRECARRCVPRTELRWRGPLVVMDIDGVLDRMVFGFPCTTASGIQALSLLHAHDIPVAVNTARTLTEVKEYCRAYGFLGGAAEYGSAVWDAVGDREQVLVSPESAQQLELVRNALRQIPGVFLNDDYQHSLRAFTYQHRRTAPLPRLLTQNLLSRLKTDRLRVHETQLDTAILAREVDKGVGLQALLEFVSAPDIETLAVGDSEPDLPMFRAATRCFAPAQIDCSRTARLLGCRIADRRYQPGLLRIARWIVHKEGGRCQRCESPSKRRSEPQDLFGKLLELADQNPRGLLLRALFDPLALRVFRK